MTLSLSAVLLLVAFACATPVDQNKNGFGARERVHLASSLVDRVNAQQSLWKAEVHPHLSLLDKETAKGMMGYMQMPLIGEEFGAEVAPENAFKSAARNGANDDDLPKEFDAREAFPPCSRVISKIQDQSRCGSCWAVSSASAISDRICIVSNGVRQLEVSSNEIMSCAFGFGCHGGNPFFAFGYWKHHGVVSGGDYGDNQVCQPYPFPPHSTAEPYPTPKCEKRCSNNTRLDFDGDKHFGKGKRLMVLPTEARMRREIMQNGPVVVGFTVYEDFRHYKSGIYKHVEGEKLGGHAVRVIGWGEERQSGGEVVKYWLAANSWNTGWGEDGFFRIVRGQNECGFETVAFFATPDFSR